MLISESSIETLRGVGQSRAAMLARLGILRIDDLIRYFPHSYEDRRSFSPIGSLVPGQTACLKAAVAHDVRTGKTGGGMSVSKVRLFDQSGAITAVFFNRKYLQHQLKCGVEYSFYGKIDVYGGSKAIVNPEFEAVSGTVTGRLLPIYRLTSGLSRNMLMRFISEILPETEKISDPLPPALVQKNGLCRSSEAYRAIHMPETPEQAAAAQDRLAYDEMLLLCLRLRRMRIEQTRSQTPPMHADSAAMSEFTSALGFELTDAQKNAISEAFADMASGFAMNRLIQGDVGSGKTAVAAACIFAAARSGFQSILMAPTEILATQHYKNLELLFGKLGIRCALLTGSCSKAQKSEIYSRLADGTTDVLIGTHAVLNDSVQPARLGLVITDEQHRFGVSQRMKLLAKSHNPHTLLLSATPIPRTLALIMFRELDVSVIDQLPAGRLPVQTFLIGEDKRLRMYGFIKKIVAKGGQAYIVCPAIENDDDDPDGIKAAVRHAEQLKRDIFPELNIAVLHGKIKAEQKNQILGEFSSGKINLLVCTSVIEVGIDVPNAELIVIENAERFGLSALHQLRGRVGRGRGQSYCILMNGSRTAPERLKILTKVSDGFKIAESDLKQRGPGDFFGMRQHGLPELRTAGFMSLRILRLADSDAEQIMQTDPQLSLPEHRGLKQALSSDREICG